MFRSERNIWVGRRDLGRSSRMNRGRFQVTVHPGAMVGDILRGEEWLRCVLDRDDGKMLSTVKEMNLDVHGSRRVHRRLWRSAG